MLVVHQETQFEPNELCSPEEIEEYLRLDTAFRTVCASFCLLYQELAQKDGDLSQSDQRLILNLTADIQHKGRSLMRLSSGLLRDAESHLEALRREVVT